jgi:hypothetical protein
MKISERTLRISASSLLALLMVSAGYFLSGPSFLSNKFANAGTTDDLLKAYASKDTDGDGLPDWQEALYGTDPNKAISNQFGIPDGEAAKEGKLTPQTSASKLPSDPVGTQLTDADIPGVTAAPGSITEQFSQQFLQEYVAATNGQPMTADTQQALVTKLLAEFSARASQELSSKYTLVSVHTDPSISIRSYAGSVEQIIVAHDVSSKEGSEPLTLMDQLINQNKEAARPKLKVLAASYGAITKDLLAMSVPPSMAKDHLLLIRSFDALSRSTTLVTVFETDPLGVMGALTLFQPSSIDVLTAFNDIALVILANGEPAPGTPGSIIVNAARSTQQAKPAS